MAAAAADGPRAVTLHEHEFAVQIGLRAAPGSASARALETVLGVPLPGVHGEVTGDPDGLHVLRLAPDEFLAVDVSRRQRPGDATPCQDALEGLPGQAVDLSANRTVLVLKGPGARAVLDKSVALDLRPRVFGVGRAEATLLSTVPVLLMRSGEETWRVLPRASFAEHVVRWLADGMTEYGSACPEEESAARSVRPAQFA
ncbi:sarcosine oxidase subunit gamma [Brachybacterium saurashtrense]